VSDTFSTSPSRPASTSPPTSPPDTGSEALSRRAWGTLLVLCGALFLDALDVSMMGIALPSIQSDLGMSTSSLQWVVSGYVLGYGGFLLLGGRAADLLGRRRMFLIWLAVFVVASGLGGLATNGALLVAARFVTGVSAAFTAPAGLSIITTSFEEGPARNRALAIYTATGATGFSLGLVLGGLLSEASWRYVFFVPVVLAAFVLAAAVRLVPETGRLARRSGGFDAVGAVVLTAGMLLLVYSIVEAPEAGWGSLRTVGSLAVAGAILAGFVALERRAASPLVRLGILRSGTLVRANVGALALQGGYFGFQFIATLYMQQLRGWSAIEAGLAVLPGGLMVALLAPRIAAPLVQRFGTARVVGTGLVASALGYALFIPVGLSSSYVPSILPTMVLAGLGFALAYGPLTMAATNGVVPEEQGLASGLVQMSFQLGGALVLAIVTAVNDAAGSEGSPQGILDGFHAALWVSVIVALFGAAVTAIGLIRDRVEAVDPAAELEPEPESAAA
jgi:EmrB/QacA subfamily drug resistance transporter